MAFIISPSFQVVSSQNQRGNHSQISKGSLRASAFQTRRLLTSCNTRYQQTHTMMLSEDMQEETTKEFVDDSAPPTEETKLFVGNLSWGTTDASLGDAFSPYGTVIDARVITDRLTGKSRGFGFIEFEASASAEEALVRMNGIEVDGRPIRVDRANRRQPRRRSSDDDFF